MFGVTVVAFARFDGTPVTESNGAVVSTVQLDDVVAVEPEPPLLTMTAKLCAPSLRALRFVEPGNEQLVAVAPSCEHTAVLTVGSTSDQDSAALAELTKPCGAVSVAAVGADVSTVQI